MASEAEKPTSVEFARIINETRVGRELGHALNEAAHRMKSEDFVWVTQAIAINREVGGNLAEVRDGVNETIRERNAIRRQVKALAAEGKLSALVLMALPFGVPGFLMVSNPAYLAKFHPKRPGLRAARRCRGVAGGWGPLAAQDRPGQVLSCRPSMLPNLAPVMLVGVVALVLGTAAFGYLLLTRPR